MSTDSNEETEKQQENKCTRGEKCILIHIALTFLILLVLIIVYVVHIIVVKHEGLDAFRITRRTLDPPLDYGAVDLRLHEPDLNSIGVVYINGSPQRVICNSILLRQKWSLAPAHCVTMRTEPELAHFLPKWRIRYKDTQYIETDIKRGMVHSYFNKDDFSNNIGLLEHMDSILMPDFNFSERVVYDLLKANAEQLSIVGWNKVDEVFSIPVHFLKPRKCSQFLSPIVDAPRMTEFCVAPDKITLKNAVVHGAALLMNSRIVGFFTWGDRAGAVPHVGLAIAPYRIWIENMMTIST